MQREEPMSEARNPCEEPEDRLGMTEEQWAWFRQHTQGYGEQDENGVDVSLLRENLKLSPTERLEKHQRALELDWEIRRARLAAGLPDLADGA
jgi:hypothetical protein